MHENNEGVKDVKDIDDHGFHTCAPDVRTRLQLLMNGGCHALHELCEPLHQRPRNRELRMHTRTRRFLISDA